VPDKNGCAERVGQGLWAQNDTMKQFVRAPLLSIRQCWNLTGRLGRFPPPLRAHARVTKPLRFPRPVIFFIDLCPQIPFAE
jgi:hypothetical protein